MGFVKGLEDLLKHLGFRMQPFLPALLAVCMQLLEHACRPLHQQPAGQEREEAGEAARGAAELRGLVLRVMAHVWARHPRDCDYSALWVPAPPAFLNCCLGLRACLGVHMAGCAGSIAARPCSWLTALPSRPAAAGAPSSRRWRP